MKNEDLNLEEISRAIAVAALPATVKFACVQELLTSKASFTTTDLPISSRLVTLAERIIEECLESRIQIIPLCDPRYPHALRAIDSPPPVLYQSAAEPHTIWPECIIAIVGSRSASIQSCQRASTLACEIAEAGVPVASGLALGIDGAAHRGAIRSNCSLPTVAVLAHGLDTIYPRSHRELADRLKERGGILLSEYPPGTAPLKHHFLERNRIIAGLSRGVVVIEAGQRSGSLVTAHCAATYGRDVFVFTPLEGQSYGEGSLRLINDGALPVNSAAQILSEYGLAANLPDDKANWTLTSEEALLQTGAYSRVDLLELEAAGDLIHLSCDEILIRRVSKRELAAE